MEKKKMLVFLSDKEADSKYDSKGIPGNMWATEYGIVE